MVNVIPNGVKKTWDAWNIRGVILVSLGFQIFLILFSPLRKRINSSILTFSLWSAYLLADYSANLCIGLIFDKRNDISTTSVKDYIVVFWAPFLLLHLGGPDTITAFSLEDNQLWRRHLLSLVFQLVASVYIFLLTIPGNPLWLPTVLVFFSGIMKYIERIRSLHLASMDTFRKSVMGIDIQGRMDTIKTCLMIVFKQQSDGRRPVPAVSRFVFGNDQQPEAAGPNQYNSADRTDYVELVRKGYEYFEKFKGLIADKTYSFAERDDCREYFRSTTSEDALVVIEVELNFIYQYFFTKATVLRAKCGYVCRFASFSSILAALFIFFFHQKHGFNKFDVRVTYILLLGAVGLELVAFLMLILSDWAALGGNSLTKHFLRLKKPRWSNCKMEPYKKFKALSTKPLFRRWFGTISGFDLITLWINTGRELINFKNSGIVRKISILILYAVILCSGAMQLAGMKWRYRANNPFLGELWGFIFLELYRKSEFAQDPEKVKIICEARGGWSINEGELEEGEKGKLKPYVNSSDVAFDENLIVWHIATNICYYADDWSDQTGDPNTINDNRCFSKILSDYMFHLIAMEPDSAIMSTVAGFGQRTNEILSSLVELSVEAFRVFEGENLESGEKATQSACKSVLDGSIDSMIEKHKTSKLADAVALAKELGALEENKRWKIVAQVWVEMLSYAAINCRPDALVQQLSKGGQLISFVWLLMLHFGLGTRQFKRQALKNE